MWTAQRLIMVHLKTLKIMRSPQYIFSKKCKICHLSSVNMHILTKTKYYIFGHC